MLNKLILRRFFFRKNQDSSSDFFLPLLFMFIVALSTILIFISSLQLYDFQIKKDKFLSNPWNHIYELFIGSAKFEYKDIDGKNRKDFYEFREFRDSLNTFNQPLFSFSKSSYPNMLHLSSKTNELERVLSYTFNYKDTALFNTISEFDKDYILNEPIIYLNSGLMNNLNVKEDDYIIAKQSRVDGYKGLFKVKKIKGDTRIKCYVFNDFMRTDYNLIRFYFGNIDSAFYFIEDLYSKPKSLRIPTPYNVGYDGVSHFSLIEERKDYISGVEIIKKSDTKFEIGGRKQTLNKRRGKKTGDIITHINNQKIYDVLQFKEIINNISEDNIKIDIVRGRGTSKEKRRRNIVIPIDLKQKSFYKKLGFDIVLYEDNTFMNFNTLKNRTVDNLDNENISFTTTSNDKIILPYERVIKNNDGYTIEKPRVYIDTFLTKKIDIKSINIPGLPKDFYVEFDFFRSLEYKSSEGEFDSTTNIVQLSILNFIDRVDSVSVHQDYNKPDISDKKYFMYAKDLDNDLVNKDIMTQLNTMNVRWDNGRWKTIINLNQSLEEGKKNITILIITNFLAFLLILIIKFLLRLKLELHTIGVLKCFGYSKKVIFTTYNIGNIIIIFSGFLIGFLPIGFMIGQFLGYNFSTIMNFYSSIYVLYSLVFLLSIILVSFITTTFFLNRFTEKENIYELIKYEG